jgi:cellobiose-specific phosphotransferase system component IIC
MRIHHLFRAFVFLLLMCFGRNEVIGQTDTVFSGKKGEELRYKGAVVGIIDTVVVQVSSESGLYSRLHYDVYLEVPDSVPMRKVRSALNTLLPFSSTSSVYKGSYQAFQLGAKDGKMKTAGMYLKSAGTKRIVGLVVALGGTGISVGLIAAKQPVLGGVLGGISGLIALILEITSSADLIRAGQELEKSTPKP